MFYSGIMWASLLQTGLCFINYFFSMNFFKHQNLLENGDTKNYFSECKSRLIGHCSGVFFSLAVFAFFSDF